MDIGTEVMLRYLQSWGQSVDEKIATLNKAAKAAGLRAEWRQDADGKNAGWHGPDCERAAEFKKRLHQVWCGEFNAEARAVEALIAEREACARMLELRDSELLLMAGEMTAQELRTVKAVLAQRADAIRMRSNYEVSPPR